MVRHRACARTRQLGQEAAEKHKQVVLQRIRLQYTEL